MIIEVGHVTFKLSGFPCSPTKSATETAGKWDVPVPHEGLWLLEWLKKKGGSHSLSMLFGGQDGPDKKGELFCAHSNCQAPPTRLLHYHLAAPRNLPCGIFPGDRQRTPGGTNAWPVCIHPKVRLPDQTNAPRSQGVCHIARSHLTSHGREQPTSR